MRATQLGMEEQILAKSEKLRQLRHVVQVSFHIFLEKLELLKQYFCETFSVRFPPETDKL